MILLARRKGFEPLTLLWEHGGFVEPLLAISTPHGAIHADAAGGPQKNGKGGQCCARKMKAARSPPCGAGGKRRRAPAGAEGAQRGAPAGASA
jgi:hypothetical protein